MSFNEARESTLASSYIHWMIYLSGQCITKKGYKETTKSQISWVLYWLGIESNKRTALSQFSWFL